MQILQRKFETGILENSQSREMQDVLNSVMPCLETLDRSGFSSGMYLKSHQKNA